MNDELELLRAVARALTTERRADAVWSRTLRAQQAAGGEPTRDSIREMRGLGDIAFKCKKATDEAVARLAEVNPELVSGGAPPPP